MYICTLYSVVSGPGSPRILLMKLSFGVLELLSMHQTAGMLKKQYYFHYHSSGAVVG